MTSLPAGLFLLFCVAFAIALTPPAARPAASPGAGGASDEVLKAIDDVMWQLKLQDIADVDKFTYTSLPSAREANPTAQGAGNPMIVYA
ncbi:MAG: S9 family peptidase, partial [Acidobacteriota bacterium]|nr:S9 family peptidase [Acidobacteriota bacterium]